MISLQIDENVVITSSSFWLYDAIIIIFTAKTNERFFSVFAEYLKNSSTDIHQTYVIFPAVIYGIF